MLMRSFTLIALLTSLCGSVKADWGARYDNATRAIVIESGYIQADEYVEVRLDVPATGTKGISWVVVEHFPSQQIRRFRLYPLNAPGKVQLITFLGDDDNDTFINETDIPSYATGLGGDDYLSGGSKNDVLVGGDDNDTLVGNGGADELRGEMGFDSLDGGNGRDVLDPGDDVFEGNLVGGGAADTFHVSVGQQFSFYDLNLAQGEVEVID